MNKQTHQSLSDSVREMLSELPSKKWKYGDGQHPCFRQWRNMIDRCSDPQNVAFSAFGGRGVTITHEWYDFAKFLLDMESSYEFSPDKPANKRLNFLARKNARAGFNHKNSFWTTKSDACHVQAKTVFVDTVFGKSMNFRQLAECLKLHEGEPMPGRTSEADLVTIIPWQELRRRFWLALPLLTPLQRKQPKKPKNEMSLTSATVTTVEHSVQVSPKPTKNSDVSAAKIRIDDDVPMPPQAVPSQYGLMEVGDAVFVVGRTLSAVRSSLYKYRQRDNTGKRFQAREGAEVLDNRTSLEPVEGVHVWRVV